MQSIFNFNLMFDSRGVPVIATEADSPPAMSQTHTHTHTRAHVMVRTNLTAAAVRLSIMIGLVQRVFEQIKMHW